MLIKTLCDFVKVAQHMELHLVNVKDSDQVQAIVQPRLALAEKYPALGQPLMVTATPADLEAELVKAMTQYVPMVNTAMNNFAQIQSNLEAAQKTAREKASAKASAPSPAGVGAKNVVGKTPSDKPVAGTPHVPNAPMVPDLFSTPAPAGQPLDELPEFDF